MRKLVKEYKNLHGFRKAYLVSNTHIEVDYRSSYGNSCTIILDKWIFFDNIDLLTTFHISHNNRKHPIVVASRVFGKRLIPKLIIEIMFPGRTTIGNIYFKNNNYLDFRLENLIYNLCPIHEQVYVCDVSKLSILGEVKPRDRTGYTTTFLELTKDTVLVDLKHISKPIRIQAKIDRDDLDRVKNLSLSYSGNLHSPKYIKLPNRQFLHRFLVNCEKDDVVDHLNRDTTDNRKSNLRVGTQSDNARNMSMRKDNKSGIVGVRRGVHSNKNVWIATIGLKNFRKLKRFSVNKYGENEARAMAIKQRLEWVNKFNIKNG